jgi:hypothetical protein
MTSPAPAVLERREYTRLPCELTACFHLPDGTALDGVVRDLSFGGAWMACREPVPVSGAPMPLAGECLLAIDFPDSGTAVITCHLVDVVDQRAGLRFFRAEEADYLRVRRYLLEHAEDPADLLAEMQFFPNPAFSSGSQEPPLGHWLQRMLLRLRD